MEGANLRPWRTAFTIWWRVTWRLFIASIIVMAVAMLLFGESMVASFPALGPEPPGAALNGTIAELTFYVLISCAGLLVLQVYLLKTVAFKDVVLEGNTYRFLLTRNDGNSDVTQPFSAGDISWDTAGMVFWGDLILVTWINLFFFWIPVLPTLAGLGIQIVAFWWFLTRPYG